MEGISQHGREYHTEERRGENAALFQALRNWKGFSSDSSASFTTLTIMPSRNWRKIVINLLGQPNFSIIFQSRLCSPYRRPWSGQRRSQRGRRYAASGKFLEVDVQRQTTEQLNHPSSRRRPCSRCWVRR